MGSRRELRVPASSSRDGPCSMISLLSFLSLLVSALSSSDTASLLSTEEEQDYSDWYYLKLVSADEQDFNVSNDEDNTLMIGDCQGECVLSVC